VSSIRNTLRHAHVEGASLLDVLQDISFTWSVVPACSWCSTATSSMTTIKKPRNSCKVPVRCQRPMQFFSDTQSWLS
jgi:hypothetical protein